MKRFRDTFIGSGLMLAILTFTCAVLIVPGNVLAVDVPDGTIDPTAIQKYVIPLVIPPVMNTNGAPDDYNIAVRQFKQQILPGGIWKELGVTTQEFPATTVWSYGPEADPEPDASALGVPAGVAPAPNSQFNYPAYTVETLSEVPVSVRWINDLVDSSGHYLPHLLAVDPTVHWANPPMECKDGVSRTDCAGTQAFAYTGPVPIVTHLHGAHVDPHSDGYPEAWWLPAANNIPETYATKGTLFDDATGTNSGKLGYADYVYRQDQPATTLWYHDHTLGMTRLNVYAGPAGFWLIRGGKYDKIKDTNTNQPAVLPGPAPVAGDTVLELNAPQAVPGTVDKRSLIREIPIVIQDRSFRTDGSLFYPDDREFFEGLINSDDTANEALSIDFAPVSDVLPIWNPEAFFNVMVVNGVSWPTLEVAPAKYRFRLLNGCNSRFLNLALKIVGGGELPFFQIGAEQGFLPQVVRIETGFATPLPGNGKMPAPVPAADPQQALLMALAERADVIVDFSGLPGGTVIRMVNTGPDEPFGGFPVEPADPDTTGQVMQFVVNSALIQPSDGVAANPYNMKPKEEKPLKKNRVAEVRQVSLNEAESEQVCVLLDVAEDEFVTPIVQVPCDSVAPEGTEVVPFGPTEALLGILDASGNPVALKWTDHSGYGTTVTVSLQSGEMVEVNVTETPSAGNIEDWEIYNFTADAHPIHLHLVRFNVLEREGTDMMGNPVIRGPEPWEMGFKDTVISYPGEITRIRARFDIAGLYVWHCHIVEHEDNEMMRPYVVLP